MKVVLLQKSHNIAPFASKHPGILKKIKKGGKTLSLIPLPYVGNLHGLGVLQTFTFVTRGPWAWTEKGLESILEHRRYYGGVEHYKNAKYWKSGEDKFYEK